MNILMTGASGLIGTALQDAFDARGDGVFTVMRGALEIEEIPFWEPSVGLFNLPDDLEIDAVVHLSGAPLSKFPWSAKYKEEIVLSRVQSTLLMASQLAERDQKPKTIISASAIGIYGDRGDESLDENSPAGIGFLADTCVQWEQATQVAEEVGIRIVHARTGLVLSDSAGLLKTMLKPFRWGVGGRLGDGSQYMSWISVEDVVGGILHAIDHADIAGPLNLTSPEPVTNKDFTRTLARVIRRPALFPVPRFALRIIMGEAAGEMALPSTRVYPMKLATNGYEFLHSDLEKALYHILKPESTPDS